MLDGADGEVHGDTLAYEPPHRALGYWTKASDSVSWKFRLAQAGEYNLVMQVACRADTAGGTFEVTVAGQTLTGTVPPTKDWDTFVRLQLPPITVGSAGDYILTVKPTKLGAEALMNLRSVTLTHR